MSPKESDTPIIIALEQVANTIEKKYIHTNIAELVVDMYTLLCPKHEIAHKLFGAETKRSIHPVIIYIDRILTSSLDDTIRENIKSIVQKENMHTNYDPVAQSIRGKLGGRKYLSQEDIEKLASARKDTLPKHIREEIYTLFSGRQENENMYTKGTEYPLNQSTEKKVYEVLAQYLGDKHGIEKTPAALKSIIIRLKKKDHNHTNSLIQSNTSINSPSSISQQPETDHQE